MNDGDARPDRPLDVLVVRPRAAVERHEDSSGLLELRDPRNVQTFLGLPLDHAVKEAVHVPDGRGQDIHAGRRDELRRLFGGCEGTHAFVDLVENLRGCSDVADLAFDQDRWVDRLDRLHGSACLVRVLLDRQLGAVKDDLIESGRGRVLCVLQ